jgi:hypothetical protein
MILTRFPTHPRTRRFTQSLLLFTYTVLLVCTIFNIFENTNKLFAENIFLNWLLWFKKKCKLVIGVWIKWNLQLSRINFWLTCLFLHLKYIVQSILIWKVVVSLLTVKHNLQTLQTLIKCRFLVHFQGLRLLLVYFMFCVYEVWYSAGKHTLPLLLPNLRLTVIFLWLNLFNPPLIFNRASTFSAF